MVGDNAIVGVNAFSDNSKVFGAWHSSGGLGLEVAAMIAGDDAIDLTSNWYGKLFDNAVIRDASDTVLKTSMFKRILVNYTLVDPIYA